MRIPNDSPESLKWGLGFVGCLGAVYMLASIRSAIHGGEFPVHVFAFGVFLVGLAWIAWRWVYS